MDNTKTKDIWAHNTERRQIKKNITQKTHMPYKGAKMRRCMCSRRVSSSWLVFQVHAVLLISILQSFYLSSQNALTVYLQVINGH